MISPGEIAKGMEWADMINMADADMPPVHLSHYCDLAALQSILEKGELWASNIRFLNDKEEMQYGCDIAKRVLKKIVEDTEPGQANRIPKYQDTDFDPTVIPDVYAASFCEKSDLLSMWRGYGAGKQSVSIQFATGMMSTLARDVGFRLEKVVYGREKGFDTIHHAIISDRHLMEMLNFPDWFDIKTVYEYAPLVKNEHFSEEQEWRLISALRTPDPLTTLDHVRKFEPEYRMRDNVLLPFLKVAAIGGAISTITVGPGKESELTKRSIEHYLKGRDHLAHIAVELSKIPYRT